MAYCEIEDLYKIGIHGTEEIDDTTFPNTDQIEFFIDKISQDIDSKLFASGVTVPVDETLSPNAYNLIKYTAILGVAGEISKLSYVIGKNISNLEDAKTANTYLSEYQYRLDTYCKYTAYLIDAVRTSNYDMLQSADGSIMWSYNSDNYDFTTSDSKTAESLKPFFKMDDIY